MAAELTGLHPQTLRAYERMGLIAPGRTGGGGRRYSHRDIELLRVIADLTCPASASRGCAGSWRWRTRSTRSALRNEELLAEIEATREALRQALSRRQPATVERSANLPVLRQPLTGQSIVVWRRGRA